MSLSTSIHGCEPLIDQGCLINKAHLANVFKAVSTTSNKMTIQAANRGLVQDSSNTEFSLSAQSCADSKLQPINHLASLSLGDRSKKILTALDSDAIRCTEVAHKLSDSDQDKTLYIRHINTATAEQLYPNPDFCHQEMSRAGSREKCNQKEKLAIFEKKMAKYPTEDVFWHQYDAKIQLKDCYSQNNTSGIEKQSKLKTAATKV